jgi:uncharacterized membrane protein (DUF106 family)
MWVFNRILGGLFGLLFFPFRHLNAWFGLALVSLLTGLLMLFVFRLTSNQEGIRKVKDRIKAHLLELRLFKDNMSVTMKAQGHILRANLRYVGYSARPMLVMMVPLVLILIQLNLWFGYEPLHPGESAIVKVRLDGSGNPIDLEAVLEAPSGIEVETPPLRLEEEKEIDWRIRAKSLGIHELTFKLGGLSLGKSVVVDVGGWERISPVKVGRSFVEELVNPGEKPLPAGTPVKSIQVLYPSKRLKVLGLRLHWLIAYFALSILFGFALKRPLKIEI